MAKAKAPTTKMVVYPGPVHIREFSARDIETMGLKQDSSWRFFRGQPHEVSPKLAELLVRSGEFVMYEEPTPEVEDEGTDSSPEDEGTDSSSDDASSDQDTGEETPEENADA